MLYFTIYYVADHAVVVVDDDNVVVVVVVILLIHALLEISFPFDFTVVACTEYTNLRDLSRWLNRRYNFHRSQPGLDHQKRLQDFSI